MFAVSMQKGEGAMPRKKIDKLVDFAKGIWCKRIGIHCNSGRRKAMKSSFAKFMSGRRNDCPCEMRWAERNGDLLLFAADCNKVVWDVSRKSSFWKSPHQLELLDKSEYKFLWVTEFPLLEWNEEAGRYTAMHHPFTMPMEEDLHLIDTEPGAKCVQKPTILS